MISSSTKLCLSKDKCVTTLTVWMMPLRHRISTCIQWKKMVQRACGAMRNWQNAFQEQWHSYPSPIAGVFAPSTPAEMLVLVRFSTLHNTYLHRCRWGVVWRTHMLIFLSLGPFLSYFHFLTSFHVIANLLWYINSFLFPIPFFSPTDFIYMQVPCRFLYSVVVCYLYFFICYFKIF